MKWWIGYWQRSSNVLESRLAFCISCQMGNGHDRKYRSEEATASFILFPNKETRNRILVGCLLRLSPSTLYLPGITP
jgi:hypothetical protein